LESKKFDKYYCQEKKEYCIDLVELNESLLTSLFDCTLTLYVDSDDLDHLGVKVLKNDVYIDTTIKLKFLDYENTNKYVDSVVMDNTISISDQSYFERIIESMSNIYDNVSFELYKNKVVLSCSKDTVSIKTFFYATEEDIEDEPIDFTNKFDLKSLSTALDTLNCFISDEIILKLYLKDGLLVIGITAESLGYMQIGIKSINT
jgi:hypothetical protein